MTKKDWTERVINSLEGASRAEPPEECFLSIAEEIGQMKTQASRHWMGVAAAIVLVICANVYLLSQNSTDSVVPEQEAMVESLITTYNIYD